MYAVVQTQYFWLAGYKGTDMAVLYMVSAAYQYINNIILAMNQPHRRTMCRIALWDIRLLFTQGQRHDICPVVYAVLQRVWTMKLSLKHESWFFLMGISPWRELACMASDWGYARCSTYCKPDSPQHFGRGAKTSHCQCLFAQVSTMMSALIVCLKVWYLFALPSGFPNACWIGMRPIQSVI